MPISAKETRPLCVDLCKRDMHKEAWPKSVDFAMGDVFNLKRFNSVCVCALSSAVYHNWEQNGLHMKTHTHTLVSRTRLLRG